MQYIPNYITGNTKNSKEDSIKNSRVFDDPIGISSFDITKSYEFSDKLLGKGAYGVVYKAREKSTHGEWRAVKKIAKKNIKQPDILAN